MRARSLKPGFFVNDELVEMAPLARILYAGLWCVADREGRLEDRPAKIKMCVLPADSCDVGEMLTELTERGFLVRYEVNGRKYLWIKAFGDHQRPHKNEQASTIPPPPEQSTTKAVPEHNQGDCGDALTPDSGLLTPDSSSESVCESKISLQAGETDTHAPEPVRTHPTPLPQVGSTDPMHAGLAAAHYSRTNNQPLYFARNIPQPETQAAIRIWEDAGLPRLAPGERARLECAVLPQEVLDGMDRITQAVAGNTWLRANWSFARAVKPANAAQILNGEYLPDGQAPDDTDALANRVWERTQATKREKQQQGAA